MYKLLSKISILFGLRKGTVAILYDLRHEKDELAVN